MQSLPNLIRPIGAYRLCGLEWRSLPDFTGTVRPFAISLDGSQGNLLQIDPHTEGATVLNPLTGKEFCDATGLAFSGDTLWIARHNAIAYCTLAHPTPEVFVELPHAIHGIAVSDGAVYVSSPVTGQIYAFGRATRGLLRSFPAPGIGPTSLTLHEEALWACDTIEQTVYCLDPKEGTIRFRALTPFAGPTGIGFCGDAIYVVYTHDEAFVRDNPNDPDNLSVGLRDNTFIHQLKLQCVEGTPRYTLSNGYLVEMTYVEEIAPEEELDVKNLTWRIALPSNTHRQTVRSVEPIGLPFREETVEGQRVAVFELGTLQPDETHIFGWKATLELRGIKYELRPEDVEGAPLPASELQVKYLVDDDGLAMDHPTVLAAAREATQGETNLLRKMQAIRDYVYDKLSYRMLPYIDAPDEVLAKGEGSCGEYVGVLLALARLNAIVCRTVGRYKCPPFADRHNLPLYQDYNHVWIEFYVPGWGWLPMESNPDDLGQRPYPTRFFMGLPWYHVEIGKGISFETIKPQPYSIGELALNHVRFKILGEL